jgi:hypothetical protein
MESPGLARKMTTPRSFSSPQSQVWSEELGLGIPPNGTNRSVGYKIGTEFEARVTEGPFVNEVAVADYAD